MSQLSRPTIIAGNWKMFMTIAEATDFISHFAPAVKGCEPKVYLAVPFTLIGKSVEASLGTNVVIGAQNMHNETGGAFTGEISAPMLRDVKAQFVLLGHSERRHIFGETSPFINKKVKRALLEDIQPIVCIGETKKEREGGTMKEVIEVQLNQSLSGVSASELEHIVIAYEPVWAIGSGLTATPEQAQEVHLFCREIVKKKWGKEAAERIPILYGGSVKPSNVRILMDQPDLDGVLVGGASLSADSFAKIVNFQTTKV